MLRKDYSYTAVRKESEGTAFRINYYSYKGQGLVESSRALQSFKQDFVCVLYGCV